METLAKVKKKKKKETRLVKHQEVEMSFLDHLEDLRMTIMKCVIVLVIMAIIVGVFVFKLNDFLLHPFDVATAGMENVERPRVNTPFGPILILFQTALVGSFVLSLPFLLYFVAQFILPALTKRERKVLFPAFLASIILFLFGACMAYFVLAPLMIKFSISIGNTAGWTIMYDIESYYSTICWLILGVGVSFELPLLVTILIYVGLLKPSFLRKHRRVIIVLILIFSAFVTPPDIVSLLVMSIPLYMLYEGSVIVGEILLKRKLAAEKIDEEKEQARERKRREKSYKYKRSASTNADDDIIDVADDPRYAEREFKRIENSDDAEASVDASPENSAEVSDTNSAKEDSNSTPDYYADQEAESLKYYQESLNTGYSEESQMNNNAEADNTIYGVEQTSVIDANFPEAKEPEIKASEPIEVLEDKGLDEFLNGPSENAAIPSDAKPKKRKRNR